MTRSMTRWALASGVTLAAVGAVTALGVAPATADSGSEVVSEVTDSVDDMIFSFNEPYQDVVRARITKTSGGDFHLLMEMASPVPESPATSPTARREMWWIWAFELDPATKPSGHPFLTSQTIKSGMPPEFLVYVSWDGAAFAGTAIDRRPLLSGGEAIVTPVEFDIDGTILTAVLPADVIGDVPADFVWGPFTVDWSGPDRLPHWRWADYGADNSN